MNTLLLIGLITVAIFVIVWLYRNTDKPTAGELELAKRLDDEFIYDPVTGKKMTLEQAEKGNEVDDDIFDRIKSDEEIESNYFGSTREVEYVARFFQQKNIPDSLDGYFDNLISQSKTVKQFDRFDTVWFWEYNSDVCFVISSVTSQYPGASAASDHELILLVKASSKINFLDFAKDAQIETTDEWMIVRLPRSVTFKEFKRVINYLNTVPDR